MTLLMARRVVRRVTPGVLLVVLSLALNLVLAKRVRVLEGTIAYLRAESELAVGAHVDPIEISQADGTVLAIDFADADVPTLLYVMSPYCVWCQRNNPNMNALIAQAGPKYRIYVLSLSSEGTAEYRSMFGVNAGISLLSFESQRTLRVGGTPTTLLISEKSLLLGKWIGAYGDEARKEIEEHLAVTLPGLGQPEQGPRMSNPPGSAKKTT